jgi:outer membrane lipoprotein-sorting protein
MKKLRPGLMAALALFAAAPAALAVAPAAAGAATPSGLSAQDQVLVDRAAAYIQALASAKGRFVQTDARGGTSQGTFYIKRPGKIRFEYDAPSGLLVVSDGYNVKVSNPRLKTFDTYPLGRTPLSVFLAKQVRLDKGVVVERVDRTSDGFQITARDGKNRGQGAITLAFADGGGAMRLKEWTVVDAQGGHTRVQLSSLEAAGGLDDSLFTLRNPKGRSGPSS